jgi:hypothetical protein
LNGPVVVDVTEDGLFALELLIPAVLCKTYPEWCTESIDGFRIASVQRHNVLSLTMLGLCILITDQSVTPFELSLSLVASGSMADLEIQIGEPGIGSLGISGPPCNSQLADALLAELGTRQAEIAWVYKGYL